MTLKVGDRVEVTDPRVASPTIGKIVSMSPRPLPVRDNAPSQYVEVELDHASPSLPTRRVWVGTKLVRKVS